VERAATAKQPQERFFKLKSEITLIYPMTSIATAIMTFSHATPLAIHSGGYQR
jgi:hypothetical protein